MSKTQEAAGFVLWREVLFAYAAPALCAGAGGLATGRTDLLVAAVTSIAGTSAAVAFVLGLWLRRRAVRHGRPRRASSVALAAGSGVCAALLAACIAQFLVATTTLTDRIRVDFPIAAALAATIITWRWISNNRKADR